MKSRTWIYLALLALASLWLLRLGRPDGATTAASAFERHLSGITLTVPGVVERLLDDDTRAPRHQRFIICTATGQTILVAHNLDVAQRVPARAGDKVVVRGRYEWNGEGGLLHETHGQPRGPGGWIRLERTGRR